MMVVMGGISCSCQYHRIGCLSLLGYARSLLRVVGRCLIRIFSVHIIPRVWVIPSGMFRARQGGRDRVQLKNPAVAGLQDPRTLSSARDVIERPVHIASPWALLRYSCSLAHLIAL